MLSVFNAAVRGRKLNEVENDECISHNFRLFAIFVAKFIRVGLNLILSSDKSNFAPFL